MSDWLDQMIGDWTFEGHGLPDTSDTRRSGTETVTRRGAWVVIESSDEVRFQLAQDPETGRVAGDFVSWAEPALWTYDGAVEDDGCLHLRSRGPSFDVEGETADYDDVFEIVSPDMRRLTGRTRGSDGVWRDFTVTTYHRRA